MRFIDDFRPKPKGCVCRASAGTFGVLRERLPREQTRSGGSLPLNGTGWNSTPFGGIFRVSAERGCFT